MRTFFYTLLLVTLTSLLLSGCFYGRRQFEYHAPGENRGVDKRLKEKVILYAVFVDSKIPKPWSAHDINSTKDSIYKAAAWLEAQATLNGIPLDIEVVCHSNKKIVPITKNLPNGTLSGTLYPNVPVGVMKLRRWADGVSKQAGLGLPKDTSSIIRTPNKIINRERLLARLRDIYKTDNVALIFFINNYYTEEISVAIDSRTNGMPEFAIVSFKDPAVIAHEFLHLFGAIDLYADPLYRKKKQMLSRYEILKDYPDEVMANTYRRIETLQINDVTKYFIGWKKELDEKYKSLLFNKKVKIIKYK